MYGKQELEYFGTHQDPRHSYGGYAPNMSGTPYSIGGRPQLLSETSTTKRDYLPPSFLTGKESNSASVFLGRSGFSVAKALHNPTSVDVRRAKLAQASDFYNLNSKLNSSCNLPDNLQTESYERYSPSSLTRENCGLGNNYWMESPGSRDSGFTNCYSSINPVYWRQHDPLMDQLGKNPPEVRMNAASVSQTDYQPHQFSDGSSPIAGTIKCRGTSGTGFTVSKELKPCFLPEKCVYGKHDTSFLGDPARFQTIYGRDYKHRMIFCDIKGREIVGSGAPLNGEQSKDFTLGCGFPPEYLTEMRERYTNHWPLEGQRTFGLGRPVGPVSSSGFTHSVRRHGAKSNPCPRYGEGDFDLYTGNTDPQRYNPWPRFYLGHKQILDKGYRPNPILTGIDYAITTSLPTTSNEAQTYLY